MIFNRSERDNRFARAVKKSLVPLLGGAGALHFLKPEPFDGIVPPQLPGTQRTYTYVSGAAELATAALLANPKTRPAGGFAAACLFTLVWPGNIYMAYLWRHEPWHKQLISLGRLPLQIPLIRAGLDIARGV